MPQIDKIDYAGQTYEFVDQKARDLNTLLSQKVTSLDKANDDGLKAETTRATLKENALENTKVTKIDGKSLSANDFSDAYKSKLDSPAAMTGATAEAAGSQGDVPAPAIGDNEKYLDGSAHWSIPHDTTYADSTQTLHGLMSAADKKKLDNIDTVQDNVSACTTTFPSDGSITSTLGNGKSKVTTFNADSSITTKITNSAGTVTTLITTFNADSSITRTVTVKEAT